MPLPKMPADISRAIDRLREAVRQQTLGGDAARREKWDREAATANRQLRVAIHKALGNAPDRSLSRDPRTTFTLTPEQAAEMRRNGTLRND